MFWLFVCWPNIKYLLIWYIRFVIDGANKKKEEIQSVIISKERICVEHMLADSSHRLFDQHYIESIICSKMCHLWTKKEIEKQWDIFFFYFAGHGFFIISIFIDIEKSKQIKTHVQSQIMPL